MFASVPEHEYQAVLKSLRMEYELLNGLRPRGFRLKIPRASTHAAAAGQTNFTWIMPNHQVSACLAGGREGVWQGGDVKNADIQANSTEGASAACPSTGSRHSKYRIIVVALLLLLLAALAVCISIAVNGSRATGDTGSYLVAQGSMTSAEAQEMLDEQTDASRITVSVAPFMRLKDDGSLRVNFIVEEPNNGFSERIEIEQDNQLVYSSGSVKPGFAIEWCQAPNAHVGPAVATVYALENEGGDYGNPVSVEVEIVAE